MRVLYFLGKFPQGSQTFIGNQMTGLIDAGVEVHVMANRTSEADKAAHWPERLPVENVRYVPQGGKSEQEKKRDHRRRALRRLTRLRPGAIRAWDRERFGPQAHQGELTRCADVFESFPRPDVVHSHFGPNGERLAMLQALGVVKQPTLTHVQGYGATMKRVIEAPRPYRFLSRHGTKVHCVCAYLMGRMEKLGVPARLMEVHRNGIDVGRFAFRDRGREEAGRVAFVSVGRFVEKKGHLFLVRAFAAAVREGLDAGLTLVGDGALRKQLEAEAAEGGVADRVRFTGWLKEEQVAAELDRADVFALTCVTAANGDMEGLPTVLPEAMARGLPVLSTRHSGVPEIVQDGINGFLADERDVEETTRQMHEIAARSADWGEIGRAGRAEAEANFDIVKLNAKLIRDYEGMIAGNR